MRNGLDRSLHSQFLIRTASASGGIPTNWDDFRKVAFALTVRDDRGNIVRSGSAMGTTNNITNWPDILAILMLQNSVDLANPDAAIDAQGRNLGADALRYFTVTVTDDRDFLSKVVRNYELAQNAPNPFNPATRIGYAIPSLFDASGKPLALQPRVSLKIYDMRGRLVRTLVDNAQQAGRRYSLDWNGREANGRLAASGVYIYRVDIGGKFVQSKKMTLVK